MQNDATVFPGWSVFFLFVMTFLSTRSMNPSENISVCIPRSFFSVR